MEHAKFWHEFFQLYKDLPALWRVRSTEYTDRVLKFNCYMELISKLREIYPDADREMVVKKINNFRTSYRKELRRIKESKKNGKTYQPTLWYFDCLSFLDDHDEHVGEKSFNEDENTEEKKQANQDVVIDKITCKKLPTKNYGDFKKNKDEEILPKISKRKKIAKFYRKKKFSQVPYEEQHQAKIDADILAKSWSIQYKDLQGNQKLIARKLISDILFYGCLGTLNMSHAIDLQEMLLKEATKAPQPQSPIDSNSTLRFAQQEYFNYDSIRESPLEFSSRSSPLLPTTNSVSELHLNDIKFELWFLLTLLVLFRNFVDYLYKRLRSKRQI